jgi:hypothetical protein
VHFQNKLDFTVTSNLRDFLTLLYKNLGCLEEIKAKQADLPSLRVTNQIDDYKTAINLTQQAINQEISAEELEEGLAGLDLNIDRVIIMKETISKEAEELVAILGQYNKPEDLKKLFQEKLDEAFSLGLRIGGYFEKNAITNVNNFKVSKNEEGNIVYRWDEV